MPLEEYVLILQAIVLTPLALVVVGGAVVGAVFVLLMGLGSDRFAPIVWPLTIAGAIAAALALAELVFRG